MRDVNISYTIEIELDIEEILSRKWIIMVFSFYFRNK